MKKLYTTLFSYLLLILLAFAANHTCAQSQSMGSVLHLSDLIDTTENLAGAFKPFGSNTQTSKIEILPVALYKFEGTRKEWVDLKHRCKGSKLPI